MSLSEEWIYIQKLLCSRIGLNAGSLTDDVWNRIFEERMNKCKITRPADYLLYLKSNPKEWENLIEEVVVPETWFFRDQGSFNFLVHHMHSNLLHSDIPLFFRILSLPCATGEEPYSIVMALEDIGFPQHLYDVHGIDVSNQGLKKAEKGLYKKNSFRGNYHEFQQRYFVQTPEGYQVKNQVADKVTFMQGNIMDPLMNFNLLPYDIIFCRNLFIYLVPEAQQILIRTIDKIPKPGGILFVAPVEIELVRKAGFNAVGFPRGFAFKKGAGHSAAARVVETKPINIPEKKITMEEKKKEHLLIRAQEEVILQATKYADEGEYQKAEELCFNFIETEGGDPAIYFILGLIKHAQGSEDRAEDFFLKTLYLDPKHFQALVYLGLLCEKKGNLHKAELYRKRAEKITNHYGKKGD